MATAVLLLIWLLATSVSASFLKTEQPPSPRFRSIGYAGTGCPQGSIDVRFDNDRLDMIFDPSISRAEVGNGSAPSAQRRACTAQIELTYTGGWHFAIDSLNVTGRVQLDVGTTAQLVVKSFFSGVPGITLETWNLAGPTKEGFGDTMAVNSAKLSELAQKQNATMTAPYTNSTTTQSKNIEGFFIMRNPLFGPCGGDGVLNVQASAALQQNAAGSTGKIWMYRAKAGIVWKKCGN